MAAQDQLEIIGTGGEINFYDLSSDKGVTNIGRNPENDIVVDSPGVAPFQAMLDHRQRPFQILNLGEPGAVKLAGVPLLPNVFQEVREWDTIEIDGHSLILLAATAGVTGTALPMPALLGAQAFPGVAEPEAVMPPDIAAPAVGLPTRAAAGAYVDRRDELIVIELSARQWTVDVEQSASCELTIANGGTIVATFGVAVEGLDESWVTITPPRVNLYEGGRATVTLSFTAPRDPSSRAGAHPLGIRVTSPNYPGHLARLSATLIINPYYDLAVGDLSPRQQSVSYRRRSGSVIVPITNKGNSEAAFRLTGEDDRKACAFEFQLPGEEASLVRQAEVRLPAEETLPVPILITPNRRQLIALRKRRYAFTVTVAMVEGAQMPRTLLGRLSAAPLIGPGVILLTALILAALALFFFRPAQVPSLELLSRESLRPGAEVTLGYNASRFPSLSSENLLNRLNALFLDLNLQVRTGDKEWQAVPLAAALEKPGGSVVEAPIENVQYRLLANTWLSKMLAFLKGESLVVPVYITPVEPKIITFKVDQSTLLVGQTVTVYWEVVDAETLSLDRNGLPEGQLTDADLRSGHRSFVVEEDTTFVLTAANSSSPRTVQDSVEVDVVPATATPIPTPVILRFDAEPRAILAGETVRVGWEVTGADTVSIVNVGDGLSLKGDVGQELAQSSYYQLTAFKSGDDGSQVKNTSPVIEIVVSPQPTATPVPQAPQILVFEATPKEVIAGKGQMVRLTWSVAGETTDIEISAPNLNLAGLQAEDMISVTVEETTLFVLTALNGDLRASKAVEIKAIEPTPTPTPTPIPSATPLPTATPTPYPAPVVVYYLADGLDPLVDVVVFLRVDESESGPIYVYQVQGGSRVKLSWEVRNAETVVLQNFGPQPAIGSVVLPSPVIASGSYMLTAENNGGANVTNAFIQIEITSPEPPPPPFNVTGVEDAEGGTNTIRWSYRPADRDLIIGFRIYRADFPPGTSFVGLEPIYDPDADEWTDDTIDVTCGKAYFVVALYTDYATGDERETSASTTSWYSRPCQ